MKIIRFFIFEKSYSKKLGFVLQTDKAFNSIFSFVKEDGLTFLCLKEKLQKKQTSLGGLSACRTINCVAKTFTVPGIAVPQNSASVVRKAKRLEIVGSRTNGFDLMARVRVGATSREPRNATLCGNAFHDSWELSLVWEQVGASTNLRTFPHHDLAPNGLLQGWQRKFRRTAKKDNFTAPGGTKISCWGDCGFVSAP